MLFPQFLTFPSVFGLVMANTITFISLDEKDRTIWSRHKPKCKNVETGFCRNENLIDIKPFNVTGFAHYAINVPLGWEGNFYATAAGTTDRTGMLAEIAWQGFEKGQYFDVSAIENPGDHVGVKQLWPADDKGAEVSGCINFPCPHVYYHPDDLQTKRATWDTNFWCTLGNADLKKYPHLATWHMVYNDEWERWHPMSVTMPPRHIGEARKRFIYLPGSGDDEDKVDVVEDTTVDTCSSVPDNTNIGNETASSHSTLVTSVKKNTATPTSTASHDHSHTVAKYRTASN